MISISCAYKWIRLDVQDSNNQGPQLLRCKIISVRNYSAAIVVCSNRGILQNRIKSQYTVIHISHRVNLMRGSRASAWLPEQCQIKARSCRRARGSLSLMGAAAVPFGQSRRPPQLSTSTVPWTVVAHQPN